MLAFALSTSLLWGLADFGGGVLSKRIPALTVVVVSQALSAVALAVLVLATGAWREAGPLLWFAVAAGAVGPVGMLSFYRALAWGPMGVVSPLAATAVAVPVGVALVLGERPGPVQVAGIAVAVAGVLLAGGPQLRGAPVQRRTVLLTLLAAGAFGAVMVLIAEASVSLPGLLLALLVQRLVSVSAGGTVLAVAAWRGAAVAPAGGWAAVGRAWAPLACVGVADVAANGTYALAAQSGPVTVAAVLASLNPVITALVARGVLRERLRGVQATGATLALTGAVLLGAA